MAKPETFESCLSTEGARVVLPAEERLYAHNLAHWFSQASHAFRFCKLCDWPLEDWRPNDAASTALVEERCMVCVTMESIMFRSDYWRRLDEKEKSARRNMGME